MRSIILLLTVLTTSACTTDHDGDGLPLGQDCDDGDPLRGQATTWFLDEDGDGWGTDSTLEACTKPTGYALQDGDCDDTDFLTHPLATEACNEVDDDCDGQVDEGHDTSGWYADVDGDGYGDPASEIPSCTGQGLVADGSDCDDSRAEVNPGALEACNGLDDDCDGRVDGPDSVDAPSWSLDLDGDLFGSPDTEMRACQAPSDAWTTQGGDCEDANTEVHPGAEEVCNEVDDDCNGLEDDDPVDIQTWYEDYDQDGYGDPAHGLMACDTPEGWVGNDLDCDDTEREVNPDTPWYADGDGDGFGDPAAGMASCTQPSGYVSSWRDCDDADAAINPRVDEVCWDDVDNDCDGLIDDSSAVDASTWYADLDGDGYGNLANPLDACEMPPSFTSDHEDCDDHDARINPSATEYCNEVDDDCDELVDSDDPSVTSLTWYLDEDDDGYGSDDHTIESCTQPEGYVPDGGDCAVGDPDVFPTALETCDAGLDNDCDGLVDTADPDMSGDGTWYADTDGDGYGDPDYTLSTCTEPSGYVRNDDDCDPADSAKWNTCWDGERVFTSCGATGYEGPAQADCDAEYLGTTLDGEVVVYDGIQEWIVPQDGTYELSAWGAQGASADSRYDGGLGAELVGLFDLDEGDVLYLLVGQAGTSDGNSGGGGGGSFVVDDDDAPLLIAGGGAGTRTSVSQDGCDAQTGTYGGTGSGYASTWSCSAKTSDAGEGGEVSSSSWGSAGGGFYSDGESDYSTTLGGWSWANGALGGYASSYRAYGGFGAGGAGNGAYGGGGGGGYSGGDGGRLAGGGGSYNDGDSPSATSAVQEGDGEIRIDFIP